MKKIITIIVCTLSFAIIFAGTPSSLPFSYSYLQRATGTEALYWNPANISLIPTKNEFMLFPLTLKFESNSLTLNLYNKTTARFLNDTLKKEILDSLGDKFAFNVNMNMIVAGYTNENWAISTATNVFMRGKLDKQYLEFLLFGNEQEKLYVFTQENNDFSLLAYQDITFGYGGYIINQLFDDFLPIDQDIIGGGTISYLSGLMVMKRKSFKGEFSASNSFQGEETDLGNGVNLNQDATICSGSMGHGVKMSFGLSSQVYEFDAEQDITVGLTIDNILGFIIWTKDLKQTHYLATIDSVYFNKLDKDIFVGEELKTELKSFTTKLPQIFRFGAKYRIDYFSASVDFANATNNHGAYNTDPEISTAVEYVISNWIPIQLGYRLPYGDSQALYSFGMGVRKERFEWGFGYQSIDALFGSGTTKGLAFSMQMKFRY